MFCFLNLYLHAKNEVDSLILSLDIADLEILQSVWLGVFCLITYKPEFSAIRNLHKHRDNNINYWTPNPEKSNYKIFGKT